MISACERKLSMPVSNKIFQEVQGDQDSIESPTRSPRPVQVESAQALFDLLKTSKGVFSVNNVEYQFTGKLVAEQDPSEPKLQNQFSTNSFGIIAFPKENKPMSEEMPIRARLGSGSGSSLLEQPQINLNLSQLLQNNESDQKEALMQPAIKLNLGNLIYEVPSQFEEDHSCHESPNNLIAGVPSQPRINLNLIQMAAEDESEPSDDEEVLKPNIQFDLTSVLNECDQQASKKNSEQQASKKPSGGLGDILASLKEEELSQQTSTLTALNPGSVISGKPGVLISYQEKFDKLNRADQSKLTVNAKDSLSPLPTDMKKMGRMKSVNFDIGLTKRELKTENEKLKLSAQNPSNNDSNSSREETLQLGFLHASPLIFKKMGPDHQPILQSIPQLSYIEESKIIKKEARRSGTRFNFMRKVATDESFIEMLQKKPKALHISCHGIKNCPETVGHTYQTYKNDGDFLLFETDCAEGHLVSRKQIKKVVSQYGIQLELVFVAACKSEFVGKIFQLVGAKHVICVREGCEILDQAVLIFTKAFYREIFAGTNICEAFKKAQSIVEFRIHKGSSNMFKMLLNEELKEIESFGAKKADQHFCRPFILQKGDFQNKTTKTNIKILPKVDIQKDVKGRTKEMFQLMTSIYENHRLIQVLGLRGIGKTNLIKGALNYIYERKQFGGGIIYINIKNTREYLRLISQVLLTIQRTQGEQERHFDYKEQNFWVLVHRLKEFTSPKPKENKKVVAEDQKMGLLLAIDNIEDILEHDGKNFRWMIQNLLTEVKDIQIILGSIRNLGTSDQAAVGNLLLVPILPNRVIVEIFLEKALSNEITQAKADELLELLMEDQHYPCQNLDLRWKSGRIFGGWGSATKEQLKELHNNLLNIEFVTNALADHDIISKIRGNPQSINFIASLYSNPQHPQSFKELYRKMQSDEINQMIKKENPGSNDESLIISCECATNEMEKFDPEALVFFYFLSMLPCGVNRDSICKMWGEISERTLNFLHCLQIIDVNDPECQFDTKRVKLNHVMQKHAEDTIKQEDKDLFNNKIAEFYQQILYEYYNTTICQEEKQVLDCDLRGLNIDLCIARMANRQEKTSQKTHPTSDDDEVLRNIDDLASATVVPRDDSPYSPEGGSPKRKSSNNKLNQTCVPLFDFKLNIGEEVIGEENENSARFGTLVSDGSDLGSEQPSSQQTSSFGYDEDADQNQEVKKHLTIVSEKNSGDSLSRASNLGSEQVESSEEEESAVNEEQNGGFSCYPEALSSVPKLNVDGTVEFPDFSGSDSDRDLNDRDETDQDINQAFLQVPKSGLGKAAHNQSQNNLAKFGNQAPPEINTNLGDKQCTSSLKNFKNDSGERDQKRLKKTMGKLELYSKFNMTHKIRKLKLGRFRNKAEQQKLIKEGQINMCTSGRFILLCTVTLFMQGLFIKGFEAFRKSYKVAETCDLFKANMARLQAIYLMQQCSDDLDVPAQIRNLKDAIELTEKALKLFSFEKQKLNRCIHGAAVSLFQIGFLYELLNRKLQEQICLVDCAPEQQQKTDIYCLDQLDKEKIKKYYKDALKEFEKVGHMLGKQMSGQRISSLRGENPVLSRYDSAVEKDKCVKVHRHTDPSINLMLELDFSNTPLRYNKEELKKQETKRTDNLKQQIESEKSQPIQNQRQSKSSKEIPKF